MVEVREAPRARRVVLQVAREELPLSPGSEVRLVGIERQEVGVSDIEGVPALVPRQLERLEVVVRIVLVVPERRVDRRLREEVARLVEPVVPDA